MELSENNPAEISKAKQDIMKLWIDGVYNGAYESIYKTQVTTHIQRILQNFSNDFKQDKIGPFLSSNPNSQLSQWLNKSEGINAIIGIGYNLSYTIDEANGVCTLNIAFSGNIKNLEIGGQIVMQYTYPNAFVMDLHRRLK